jgi:hypothetical protein
MPCNFASYLFELLTNFWRPQPGFAGHPLVMRHQPMVRAHLCQLHLLEQFVDAAVLCTSRTCKLALLQLFACRVAVTCTARKHAGMWYRQQ